MEANFQSKFTIFEKIEVNGPNTHPVYRYLRNRSPLFDKSSKKVKVIPWNFSKFLLDGKGEVVRFFEPGEDLNIVKKAIEELI